MEMDKIINNARILKSLYKIYDESRKLNTSNSLKILKSIETIVETFGLSKKDFKEYVEIIDIEGEEY